MASTMQLEFEQAMTDFKTMFPDMDVDVIEAILRCNKGAVDATIDQLLAMSIDNQVSVDFHLTLINCSNFSLSPTPRTRNYATKWTTLGEEDKQVKSNESPISRHHHH